MKKLIKRLFPGFVVVYNRIYNYFVHYRFKNLTIEQVFSTIYKENHWGDKESKSGTGSNLKNSQNVVQIFNRIAAQFPVTSVLDVPCGDYYWMKNVDKKTIRYTGADIVQELVDANTRAYGSANVSFQKINLTNDRLPNFDLIFCRDCLVHFSYDDIRRALNSVTVSGSKYFATTTFPNHRNYDIITGDWRPLNLQAEPFNFPEPLFLENEDCKEDEMGKYKDKSLAVWSVADLVQVLSTQNVRSGVSHRGITKDQ